MSKSKVRSMQRGAQKRDPESPVTNAELYAKSPPLLTDAEIAHFQFGNRTINEFFDSLSSLLPAFQKSKIQAGRVASVLNRRRIRTACGSTWTPRLAWFLMATWRTVQAQRRPNRNDTAEKEQVERSPETAYRSALRPYFKNPTLGEMFPQLSELKRALSEEKEGEQTNHPVEIDPPPSPVGDAPSQTVSEPQISPLKSEWRRYFESDEGRAYLISITRMNRRLPDFAKSTDFPILGYLRARKSPHPMGGEWTAFDAEQLRLALAEGLHLIPSGKRRPVRRISEVIRRDGRKTKIVHKRHGGNPTLGIAPAGQEADRKPRTILTLSPRGSFPS